MCPNLTEITCAVKNFTESGIDTNREGRDCLSPPKAAPSNQKKVGTPNLGLPETSNCDDLKCFQDMQITILRNG